MLVSQLRFYAALHKVSPRFLSDFRHEVCYCNLQEQTGLSFSGTESDASFGRKRWLEKLLECLENHCDLVVMILILLLQFFYFMRNLLVGGDDFPQRGESTHDGDIDLHGALTVQ